MIDCKDILDAVYINVKATYIEHLYSKKVKNTTVNESSIVDEALEKTTLNDPLMVTENNNRENMGVTTQKVSEELERMAESEVMIKIRSELEDKIPYALASVCANLASIDRRYREERDLDEQPDFSEFYLEVGDAFPLCERFVFPCVMFVSSMVLIDIDEERSDSFYDKYALSVSQIVSEMPWEMQKTVEKYSY